MEKPWLNTNIIILSHIINQTHKQFWGEYLINPQNSAEEISKQLYSSPYVVLAHSHVADPLFIYANQCAQDLWGYSWQEFIGLPSRLSAGSENRASREDFLNEVALKGFANNYTGIRVAKDGSLFKIKNTSLWNLYAEDSRRIGQAAVFKKWEFLE